MARRDDGLCGESLIVFQDLLNGVQEVGCCVRPMDIGMSLVHKLRRAAAEEFQDRRFTGAARLGLELSLFCER